MNTIENTTNNNNNNENQEQTNEEQEEGGSGSSGSDSDQDMIIPDQMNEAPVHIFGQFFKKNAAKKIPLYRYSSELAFDPKQIWNEHIFRCTDGVYLHKKDTVENFTHLFIGDQHHDKFSIKTWKMIWPLKYQKLCEENERVPIVIEQVCTEMVWCIILCHGGKFAGAIYQNNVMIKHKTFQRYVKRAKQGKRQSNYVASGRHAKSAGGQKRNLNETKLREEIQSLLTSWQDYLQNQCTSIFVHAPGPVNTSTLFGSSEEQTYLYPELNDGSLNASISKDRLTQIASKSKSGIYAKSKKGNETDADWKGKGNEYRLWKKNPIIHKIPFTTKRVNLHEVEKVYKLLSTAWMRVG